MNKIIKYLLSFLFFIQISCQEKKEDPKTKTMTKYEWTEGTSAALGYPMEVYKGGIECEGGEWVGLSFGIASGNQGWGTINNGMDNGFKSLPKRLDFIWMSYMENQFYQVDTDIDTEKIRKYFNQGFDIKGASGKPQHLNYNVISVGMAPGGVVVVWISGIGWQKEIGRYQGKKVTIPESEIAKLDSHENRFWRKDYLDEVLNNGKVIPVEIKEKNKGKPIPLGLWDIYRTRFSWKPVFELPENAKLNPLRDIGIDMINGEKEQFDAAKNPLSDYALRAIPISISMSILDKEEGRYGAGCNLDEKSSFEAFKKVFGDDPKSTKAELVIKVNEALSFFTVKLKGENGKEAFIKTDSLEMFKSKKKN
ncbi:DUF2931 family protein [Chryseobacterium culicis]|nr:DUF2931 family protein [Chryseobacterium culicis]